MNIRINRDQVREFEPHKFDTEASSIGLTTRVLHEAGWPQFLETDLGNGRLFRFAMHKVVDGELLYARYDQDLGCISLHIYND